MTANVGKRAVLSHRSNLLSRERVAKHLPDETGKQPFLPDFSNLCTEQ
jgi:hypothetical protein